MFARATLPLLPPLRSTESKLILKSESIRSVRASVSLSGRNARGFARTNREAYQEKRIKV